MLENFELKKVFQQMKQDMVAILNTKNQIQHQEEYTEFTNQVSRLVLDVKLNLFSNNVCLMFVFVFVFLIIMLES